MLYNEMYNPAQDPPAQVTELLKQKRTLSLLEFWYNLNGLNTAH